MPIHAKNTFEALTISIPKYVEKKYALYNIDLSIPRARHTFLKEIITMKIKEHICICIYQAFKQRI